MYRTAEGWYYDIIGVGGLYIDENGRSIHIDELAVEPTSALGTTLIASIGPQLACAMQGVFCLHASAVMLEGRAVLFIGDSGRGKSTLAARLSTYDGITRLTDDISPVHGAALLPHIPQLKLTPGTLNYAAMPERTPIAAIFTLSAGDGFTAKQLTPAAAVTTLITHTFATVAFPPSVSQQHLAACSEIARHVPISAVSYPLEPASIETMHQLVAGRV
jgi:hypothetical protein